MVFNEILNLIPFESLYIKAVIFFFAVFGILKLVFFIIERYIHKLVSKTKTNVDDIIFRALGKPILYIILLASLNTTFSILPITPETFNVIDNIIKSLIVIVIALPAVKIIDILIGFWARECSKKTKVTLDDKLVPIFHRIIKAVSLIVAFLLILRVWDINITPLLASLGIAGLAVALALQDTFSNFFSAVYITADRPVKVGDYIELENGLKGYVEDVGWRSTRLRTLPNNSIIIPNNKLAQSILTNYDAPKPEMSIVIPVGVSYNSDLEKVEKVTVDVAKKVLGSVEGGVADFEPFIRYKEFGDSSINFSVILRVKNFVNQYLVMHEFIKALKKRYDKEGIDIPFPQRDVHMKK